MPYDDALALAARLQSHTLRIRTGILLLEDSAVGNEAALAARLGVGHIDFAAWKVARLEIGRRYIGVSRQDLLTEVDQLLSDPNLPHGCVLLYNLDFLLSAICEPERLRFWDFLRTTLKRPRGLLIGLPDRARHLLPEETRIQWNMTGRIARVGSQEGRHDPIK